MIAGPRLMNDRGPYRAASFPNRDENNTRNRELGTSAIPAACSLYPSVPIMKMPRKVSVTYSAP
jgi:hypothetical protein